MIHQLRINEISFLLKFANFAFKYQNPSSFSQTSSLWRLQDFALSEKAATSVIVVAYHKCLNNMTIEGTDRITKFFLFPPLYNAIYYDKGYHLTLKNSFLTKTGTSHMQHMIRICRLRVRLKATSAIPCSPYRLYDVLQRAVFIVFLMTHMCLE